MSNNTIGADQAGDIFADLFYKKTPFELLHYERRKHQVRFVYQCDLGEIRVTITLQEGFEVMVAMIYGYGLSRIISRASNLTPLGNNDDKYLYEITNEYKVGVTLTSKKLSPNLLKLKNLAQENNRKCREILNDARPGVKEYVEATLAKTGAIPPDESKEELEMRVDVQARKERNKRKKTKKK